MKNNVLYKLILTAILVILFNLGFAIQMQKKILTKEGYQVFTIENKNEQNQITPSIIDGRDEIQLLWQGVETISTGGQIKVSSTTQNTFTGWNLNDDRCALYNDCFFPLWINNFGPNADFCIDMLEDGSLMAAGKDTSAKVFQSSSNMPIWEHTFTGNVLGIALSPDGSTVYASEETSSYNKVYSFNIETSEINWENNYDNDYYKNGLILSGNGEYLVFYQYCNIYILNSEDGSAIDQVSNYGEGIPSISDDGSILVVGDYTGEAQVYEYNTINQTYNLLWDFQEDGGDYDPWITSMKVSGDGNTIAIGTLIYVSLEDDIFDGRVHLFDTYSGELIWIFENMEHLASSIDMSHDASIIAVGSWGPVDNSVEDFFLFERNSNEPIFSINTSGSIRFVDLSPDGTMCSLSGKAIHETTFGNGGTIYCVAINSTPPAPENIVLEGNENEITLSWNMPNITNLDYFNIYYSINENEFALLDTTSSATFTYVLPNPDYYQFYVTTIDTSQQESEPSEIVLYNYVSIETDNLLPMQINFLQNYPNPFNPSTTISYNLISDENVLISIYNVKGEKIVTLLNEFQVADNYNIIWNGTNDNGKLVSSGIYLTKIDVKNVSLAKKMILIK